MKKVYEPGEALYIACTVVAIGFVRPWALLTSFGKATWATRERAYNNMMVDVQSDEQTDDSAGVFVG